MDDWFQNVRRAIQLERLSHMLSVMFIPFFAWDVRGIAMVRVEQNYAGGWYPVPTVEGNNNLQGMGY